MPDAGGGQQHGESTPRTRRLADAVREAACSAADSVGGGIALVFGCPAEDTAPGTPPLLRAAAGFGSAQEARRAAARLIEPVCRVLESRSVSRCDAQDGLGERAAAGLWLHPLLIEDHLHGVLAVGSPSSLDAQGERALLQQAELLALRFDHSRMLEAKVSAEREVDDARQGVDEKSEELLKLSEALFAQDIELLRTNEKLGKVEKLKTDFIERMSRELRTPLNGIIEAIISVLTNEHDRLSSDSKQALRHALDDSTGFLRTLQNILDLWRIKQGELPTEIQDVNFRETVDEAIFSVQDAIAGKPIEIEQEIAEAFPKIRTDLTKINQILFLLLDNAVRFTPRGTVRIKSWVEEDRLRCEISDTGIGICPDDRPYVFDEFFQVDTASSRRYRGAGLGLALVRDLVVMLEGEISLSSEVGQGSTFSFALPVQVVG